MGNSLLENACKTLKWYSLALAFAASDNLIPEYHSRFKVTLSLSVKAALTKISSCSFDIAGNNFLCLLDGDIFSIGLVDSCDVLYNHLQSTLMQE
jgi:hypothetical protein